MTSKKKTSTLKTSRKVKESSSVKPLVSIIMGSQSDLKCMKKAKEILKKFKIPFEMKVVSAHRTPKEMQSFALQAQKRGLQVILAGAGGSAHLPGMVASLTSLPVIGVPVESRKLKGLDSLLSIAQMPEGVPVACMPIEGAKNAALLAIRILALNSTSLDKKIKIYHEKQKSISIASNKKLSSYLYK